MAIQIHGAYRPLSSGIFGRIAEANRAAAAPSLYFNGNFDDDILTQYDSTSIGSGNAFVRSTDAVFEGTHNGKITYGTTADNANATAALGDLPEFYAACVLRVATGFQATPDFSVIEFLEIYDGATPLWTVAFQVWNATPTLRFRVWDYAAVERYAPSYNTTLQMNTDTTVEVYFKAGTGSDGAVELWTGGVSRYSATGLATSIYAADSIRIGAKAHSGSTERGTSGSIFYVDQAQVSPTRIFP